MSLLDYYNRFITNYPIDDLKYLLGFIVIIYLMLIAFRLNGVFKKSDCPKCYAELKRKPKTLSDRILVILCLGILPLRRYECEVCKWEGMRWNTEPAVYGRKKMKSNRRLRTPKL